MISADKFRELLDGLNTYINAQLAADSELRAVLIAAALLIFIYLALGPLSRLVSAWPRRWLVSAGFADSEQARNLLTRPFRLVIFGASIYGLAHSLSMGAASLALLQKLAQSLMAIGVFLAVLVALPLLRTHWQQLEEAVGVELMNWLAKGLRVATLLVAAATLLQLWGIQVAPIIAGAGLFGIAVALGAQAFFKNLIGGVLILLGKRFQQGDWIEVPGVIEGTVETIGFHSTVVRRFDKAPAMLPNTLLSDATVINYSRRPHRRISWTISLVYQTSVPQLTRIRDQIELYLLEHDDFISPPQAPVFVRIDKLSESSIDLCLYCFTHTADWVNWLDIKEKLAFAVLEIVEQAGSSLAYPSQTLYIEHADDSAPSSP